MMKKCISIFLVSILFITAVKAAGGFIDVGPGHAYKDAIYYAYENGIVKGYSDMTYRPDELITRGQFTKIIIGSIIEEGKILMFCSVLTDSGQGVAYSPPPPEFYETKDFSDVNRTDTFGDYICYAKANNIISGYSDGTFRPGNNITLSEASKIIVTTFGLMDPGAELNQYVSELISRNAIPEEVKSRDSYLSRGQMAEIIYRIKNSITNKSFTDLLHSSTRSGRIEFAGKNFIYDMSSEVESIERNASNISIWMLDGSKFDLDYIVNDYGYDELDSNLAINAVLNNPLYQCIGDASNLSIVKTGIENIYNYSIVKSSENCGSDGQNENYHMKVYEDRSNDTEIVQFMFSGIVDDGLDFDSLLRMDN
ncbi:S-layer homology domain-containing protein [Candidatus Dojkabacteria bacterium]|nr:S-layer homology domain-containing protein [Candidatus Dojkabacteria bacterium]